MTAKRYKSLLLALLGIFLAIIISFAPFTTQSQAQQMASPISPVDPFDQVQLKLEEKSNNLTLKRPVSLIETAQAAGDFNDASSYIVVDMDGGEIILEKSSSQALYIASLTKVMTAIVASDLMDLNEQIVVSESAPKVVPTNMGLIPGHSWTLEELLHGLLMTSSNDTANAIKEGIDAKYGEGTFIRAMNAKSKFIGLKTSSFDNPQGFDGIENFSTAEDLALLTMYFYKNYPELKSIASKEFQFFPETLSHKQADLYNWNGLLGVYPGSYGLKIGNTSKAGKTTIVASEREGKKVLVVLLGAPGILERDLWAAQLLDLGFSNKFQLAMANVTKDQLKAKYATWK